MEAQSPPNPQVEAAFIAKLNRATSLEKMEWHVGSAPPNLKIFGDHLGTYVEGTYRNVKVGIFKRPLPKSRDDYLHAFSSGVQWRQAGPSDGSQLMLVIYDQTDNVVKEMSNHQSLLGDLYDAARWKGSQLEAKIQQILADSEDEGA